MKLLLQFALCSLVAPGVFAQHHNGGGGGRGGGGRIGGGGGRIGGGRGGAISGHHAGHFRGSIRNFGYGGSGYGGFYGGGGYYMPLYDDSDYPDYPFAQPYQPAETPGSNVTLIYPPAADPVPAPRPARLVIHEYNRPEDYGLPGESQNESRPSLYLIAFRDNTIRAAATYWVEGDTLYYLDKDHKQNQAPLSSVDRGMSAQLNRERNVPFNLQ